MESVGVSVRVPPLLRTILAEGALTAAVAVAVCMRIFVSGEAEARPPGVQAYLIAVLIALLLPARHRAPLVVLVASLALLVVYHALGSPGMSPVIPLAVPLYSAALTGHLRWAVSAATASAGAAGLFPVFQDHVAITTAITQLLPQVALLAALILLGETVRSRRALAREARRAARRAVFDREREATRRVTEERLHIARELHDVLAHTLAGAAIQASVAADTLADDPATSREAVEAVRASCREARVELAATVGVLRAGRQHEGAVRTPLPGLGQLDSLLETARRAALRVELTHQGTPRALPPAVDLTAYRIIQQSLTNVVQHAAARHVTVDLTYRPAGIVLSIVDDGRGAGGRRRAPTAADGGFGILGMRERASALGGHLLAEDRPGAGFQVVADLPTAALPAIGDTGAIG